MLKFASFSSSNNKYPRKNYDGQEDQSYGFNPARKLQTGSQRGVQQLKGRQEVVDETGTTRVVVGYLKDGF